MLEGFREAARMLTLYGQKVKYLDDIEQIEEVKMEPNMTQIRSKC